jgi:hypothetical protein
MILVVYGFPTKKEALAFEWNWQKPFTSKLLRNVAHSNTGKNLGNQWKLKFKVRIMFEMMQISPWNRFPLVVQWLGKINPVASPSSFPPFPIPPSHIKQIYAPITQLDMHLQNDINDEEGGFESGEEEHDSSDERSHPDPNPTPLQRSNSAISSNSNRMDIDIQALLDEIDQYETTQRPWDQEPQLLDTSQSIPLASSSTRLRAPRRSLSANSLLQSQSSQVLARPMNAVLEAHEFHNTSIGDDEELLLHTPAFASRPVQAPQNSNRPASTGRTTAASASSTRSARQPAATLMDTVVTTTTIVTGPPLELKCGICQNLVCKVEHGILCSKDDCDTVYHVVCWATVALKNEPETTELMGGSSLIPTMAACPACKFNHRWMDLIRHKQRSLMGGRSRLKSLQVTFER